MTEMSLDVQQYSLHAGLLYEPLSRAALLYSLLLACPVILLLVRRFTMSSAARARPGPEGGQEGRPHRAPGSKGAPRRARDELLLSRLPSPPWKLPVIGHLHLVGSLSLPHISLRDLAIKHSRNGLMLLRLGAVPTLVVSSPRAAQAILRTHDHVFASRAYSPVTDILFYGSTDIVFAPYGEHWRQVKKIATTHLLTNKKVRAYRHAREQEVRLVMAKIHDAATAGIAVDLSCLLNSFANDIVCHAVSGKFFREEGQNKLFRELVEANTSLIAGFNLEDYFPILVRLNIVKRMVCAKAERVKKRWDELLDKLIDDHATRSVSQRCDEDCDFIDVLLSIQEEYKPTRDHIKAQLAILFIAGTDTSSVALEYAIAMLMRNPQIFSKLQSELKMAMPKEKEMILEDDLQCAKAIL